MPLRSPLPLAILVLAVCAGGAQAQAQAQAQTQAVSAATCPLVPVAANDEVVLVSAYEGAELSTAAVTPQEQVTTHATVEIEPGDRPIYLLLSSYKATVWTVRGDTRRVRTAAAFSEVGTSERPAAGVVGIAPARVRSLHDCLDYEDEGDLAAAQARRVVEGLLGRAPDRTFDAYSVSTIAVPSGRLSPPASRERGGPNLVRIDPASVAGVRATPYGVLPGAAGLAELVRAGTLEGQPGPGGRGGVYTLRRPVERLPAGLNGGNAVTFVLPSTLPFPETAEIGHSCIRAEGGYALRREC